MKIEQLVEAKSEITHSRVAPEPIVLSTRIRLARNLDEHSFPGWAKEDERREVLQKCEEAVLGLKEMEGAAVFEFEELEELDKQVLVERHLISPELAEAKAGAGVLVSGDQSVAVMINEEDHLRMQVIKGGYKIKRAWQIVNGMDTALEDELSWAFSWDLGYLTACPTNLGTAMRASVMMHLPGLVIVDQMEKVIRAASQLGLAVRGIFGEGSDASGSIFQISNQQTLGESEKDIMKRLEGVLDTILESERNARANLVEKKAGKLFDKVGRAYGILRYGHYVTSAESMNLLSLVRLGIDLGAFDERHRRMVDRMLVECQPAHISVTAMRDIKPEDRDAFRGYVLREKMKKVAEPNFKNVGA